jgi:hypothetical protein
MPAEKLSMRKIREILRLHFEKGLPHRAIGRSVSVSPATVGDCLGRARVAGLAWPLPEDLDDGQLEANLLELVRYLHLNPLRAGLVQGMRGLDAFRWSGHAALLGEREAPFQDTAFVLEQFGSEVGRARRTLTGAPKTAATGPSRTATGLRPGASLLARPGLSPPGAIHHRHPPAPVAHAHLRVEPEVLRVTPLGLELARGQEHATLERHLVGLGEPSPLEPHPIPAARFPHPALVDEGRHVLPGEEPVGAVPAQDQAPGVHESARPVDPIVPNLLIALEGRADRIRRAAGVVNA